MAKQHLHRTQVAPQSGKETRKQIKDFSEKLSSEVKDNVEKISEKAMDFIEDTKDTFKKKPKI